LSTNATKIQRRRYGAYAEITAAIYRLWLEDRARVFQWRDRRRWPSGSTTLSGSSTKVTLISYRLCSYTGRPD